MSDENINDVLKSTFASLIQYIKVENTSNIKKLQEYAKTKGLEGFHSTPVNVKKINGRLIALIDLEYLDVDLEKWSEEYMNMINAPHVSVREVFYKVNGEFIDGDFIPVEADIEEYASKNYKVREALEASLEGSSNRKVDVEISEDNHDINFVSRKGVN